MLQEFGIPNITVIPLVHFKYLKELRCDVTEISDKSSISSLCSALPPKDELFDVRIDAAGTANESSAISDSNVTETIVPSVCRSTTKSFDSHIHVPARQSDQPPLIDRSKKPHLEVCIKYVIIKETEK